MRQHVPLDSHSSAWRFWPILPGQLGSAEAQGSQAPPRSPLPQVPPLVHPHDLLAILYRFRPKLRHPLVLGLVQSDRLLS